MATERMMFEPADMTAKKSFRLAARPDCAILLTSSSWSARSGRKEVIFLAYFSDWHP